MEHAEITERSEKGFLRSALLLARHLSRFAEEASSKKQKSPDRRSRPCRTGIGALNIVLQKRKASSEEPDALSYTANPTRVILHLSSKRISNADRFSLGLFPRSADLCQSFAKTLRAISAHFRPRKRHLHLEVPLDLRLQLFI